jgi:hypothetical protein
MRTTTTEALLLLTAWFLSPLVTCLPVGELGINWDASSELPTVTLPYGTFRASSYDSNRDVSFSRIHIGPKTKKTEVYIFTNIRFAEPPVGDLRWRKPQPPAPISGIQDGTKGYSCKQILPKRGLNFLGSYNEEPWAADVDEAISGVGSYLWPKLTTSSEDCLFLDIYVPGSIIKNINGRKAPVFNWIYGGAVSDQNDGAG